MLRIIKQNLTSIHSTEKDSNMNTFILIMLGAATLFLSSCTDYAVYSASAGYTTPRPAYIPRVTTYYKPSPTTTYKAYYRYRVPPSTTSRSYKFRSAPKPKTYVKPLPKTYVKPLVRPTARPSKPATRPTTPNRIVPKAQPTARPSKT